MLPCTEVSRDIPSRKAYRVEKVDLMIDQGDLPWQSLYCIMIMAHSTSTKDELVLTIRATDNAVSLEGTKKLVAYLEEFAQS